ncbi:alkaline phosphatase [Vibrio astriarenae]|nr:alkaline phosphatase [Vibrio sp. C7]
MTGRRNEGDLTKDWTERFGERSLFLSSREDFDNTNFGDSDRVLGLFNDSHLSYEVDRNPDEEPSLSEMTEAALELLTNNKRGQDNGFVLSVSASRISHGHQAGNAARALTETIALSEAVKRTQQYLHDNGLLEDTLLLVASDHSYTMSIGGFGARGNSILGISETYDGQGLDGAADAMDGFSYTTLAYANGPGAQFTRDDAGNRVDPATQDTLDIDYLQQATVPLAESTSAGEDVPVFATGPRSYLVRGTSEQNSIFHIINQAAELGAQAYTAK